MRARIISLALSRSLARSRACSLSLSLSLSLSVSPGLIFAKPCYAYPSPREASCTPPKSQASQ